MDKARELLAELRQVFSGRGAGWLDAVLPPVVFLIINSPAGVPIALIASLAVAAGFTLYRLRQKARLAYAFGGLGGVMLAALFVQVSGSAAGFFLPGLISGGLTVLACVISAAVNRPLAAWSSFLTRRWPPEWYWHPRVLPAYREVTYFWAFAFAARLFLEAWLYQRGEVGALGAVRLMLGWPYIVLMLVISYLYGQRRLAALGGPSVEEFREGRPPPWEGQQRGF